MERKRVTGVVVACVAAVLVVVGSALPWLRFSTPGGSVDYSGTDIHVVHSAVNGTIIIVLALVAGACVGFSLLRKDRVLPIIGSLVAFATAALAIYDLDDIGGRVTSAHSVSIGYGLWIAAAAAVVLLVGSAMTLNATPLAGWFDYRPAPGAVEYWTRDPFGRHERRWWNGNRYTDRVVDDGVESSDQPGIRAASD